MIIYVVLGLAVFFSFFQHINSVWAVESFRDKEGVKKYLNEKGVDNFLKNSAKRMNKLNTYEQKENYILDLKIEDIESNSANFAAKIEKIQSKDNNASYIDGGEELFIISKLSSEDYEELKNDDVPLRKERRYKQVAVPNDNLYNMQWAMTNTKYDKVYDKIISNPEVVVGVIDSGFYVNHWDYGTSQVKINNADIQNNGSDDDYNGYIDDTWGCSFWGSGYYDCSFDEITNQLDSDHGTKTVSLINAKTNNGLGIAGICPNCKTILAKTELYETNIYWAFMYVADRGAKVINYSIASVCPWGEESSVIRNAMNYAANEGAVIVQSAGNNGAITREECIEECDGEVAYCNDERRNQTYFYMDGRYITSKINVAAIDSNNQRASFSNYDVGATKATTIAAPGFEVYTLKNDGSTALVNGTSFSAPIVSASVANLIGYLASYRNLTTNELKDLVVNTGSYLSTDKDISGRKINLNNMLTIGEAKEKIRGTNYAYVSRFWSDRHQGHFYTASENEASKVMWFYPDTTWRFEGIGYYAYSNQQPSTVPLYRFWSDLYQGHFYTASETEKNKVISTYPESVWRYEGIAFYVYPADYTGESLAVYRFWSDQKGHHFYTASETEKNKVISTYPESVWRYEGIRYKVPIK